MTFVVRGIKMKRVPTAMLRTARYPLLIGALICLVLSAEVPPKHPEKPGPARERLNHLTDEVAPKAARRSNQPVPIRSFIDQFIFSKMERDGVPHAGLSTDAEFLRRVHLDLTGRLPEVEAIRKFLADKDSGKREKTIDALLATAIEGKIDKPETPFLDKWTYFFGDLFRNCSAELGARGRNLLRDYIYDALLLNRPYDEVVRELLTARTRDNFIDAASNFLLRDHVDDFNDVYINQTDSYDEMAISSAKYFLGVNLECVSCHSGPGHLEKINLWLSHVRREQLWRQAAFFSNVLMSRPFGIGNEYELLDKGGHYDVTTRSARRMPRYKADLSPQFLLTGEKPKEGEPWREAYARMMTSDLQFARATVNLIWAELMGVGIVDPPTDFDLARLDPANPPPAPWTVQPSHPELLEALAGDFRDHHYDMRRLIRLIVSSSTYQLSSHFEGEWKSSYAQYFARHFVRRLPAEEICDAIDQATGIFPAIEVADGNVKVNYVLQTRSSEDIGGKDLEPIRLLLASFGQADRDKTERDFSGSTVQAAALLNSRFVKEHIKAQESGRLHKLLNHEPPLANDQIVDEMFLAFLSRLPLESEKAIAVKTLEEHHNQGLEDLAWALINKTEFLYNY
jgi:hypothetical protein